MIEATELRLGNYVSVTASGDAPVQITRNTFSHILTSKWTGTDKIGADFSIHPIPLTEEWLLKFGFEKPKDGLFGKQNYFYKEEQCGTGVDTIRIYSSNNKFWYEHSIVEIQYVHTLQNIFFALTGNELTLTPAKEEMK